MENQLCFGTSALTNNLRVWSACVLLQGKKGDVMVLNGQVTGDKLVGIIAVAQRSGFARFSIIKAAKNNK